MQLQRLPDKYQNASEAEEVHESEEKAREDEDTFKCPMGRMGLSNGERTLALQLKEKIGELEKIFLKFPEDAYADAVSEEGDNGILLAATEKGGLETVKWLLRKDVAIDRQNHYGRTALMEAALWGRFETVQYLLDQGGDIYAEDANRHSASDLANDSELKRSVSLEDVELKWNLLDVNR